MPTAELHLMPPAPESLSSKNNPRNRNYQGVKLDEGFASRLKNALDGRSQTWLANKIGLSTSTLHGYSRGIIPPADRAFLIAKALGVNPEWLVLGTGSITPPPVAG